MPADLPGEACPNCRAKLPVGAVLCVSCGFNLESGRLIQTVVEQVVTGVSFAGFHDWYEGLPIWAILLLTPIFIAVVVPLVIALLVGSLAACGFLFRLATG
jgi:hypothetical protein